MEYFIIVSIFFFTVLMIGLLHYKFKYYNLWSYAKRKNIKYGKHIAELNSEIANLQNELAKAENKLSNQNKAKQVKAYIFGKRDEHLTYASIQQASYMTGISRSTIRRRIEDGKPHYSKKLRIGLIFKH
jgi:DNA-directed RNA polymerase specialized sigma24 family protein